MSDDAYEPVESVALPTRTRAPWWVMTILGLFLAGPTLFGIAVNLDELATESMHGAFIGAGVGMFFAGFGALMLSNRNSATRVTIDRPKRQVLLTDGHGAEVAIPLASLRGATHHPAENSSSTRIVKLQKRDGGTLELAAVRESVAHAIVGPIEAALEDDETEAPKPDAASVDARLDGLKGIEWRREGDALELSWRVGRSFFQQLALLGPFGGFMLVGYGFYRYEGSMGSIIFTLFAAALTGLVLVSGGRDFGVTQRVRVDPKELLVERRRGSTVQRGHHIPLGLVVAIDYTHQLNVLGAAIVVGTTEDDSKDMMMEAVGDNGRVDAMAAFKAMRSMIANRVEIALGRLPIAHRIALDLAIGDEVARRSARQAAGL